MRHERSLASAVLPGKRRRFVSRLQSWVGGSCQAWDVVLRQLAWGVPISRTSEGHRMSQRRASATQFTRGVLWDCLMGSPSQSPKCTERVPAEALDCVLTLPAQKYPRNEAILTRLAPCAGRLITPDVKEGLCANLAQQPSRFHPRNAPQVELVM